MIKPKKPIDITPKWDFIPAKEKIVDFPLDMGQTISGQAGDRLVSTVNEAINPSGDFVNDVINANLDTQAKEILGDFIFGASGAIKMITDADNGLWLSPTGILGKKSGANTFAIDILGNATFAGTLVAAAGTFEGTVYSKRFEYSSFYFSSQYESLDGWDKAFTGTSASVVASICYLDLRPGDEVNSYARIASEFGGQSINWTNDEPIIEMVSKTAYKTVIDMWFSLGRYYSGTGNQMGFYWKYSDQTLNAVWATGATGALQSYTITGINVDLWHKYRAQKVGASIEFYIDDVLKYTATTNLPSGEDDMILVLQSITKATPGTNEVLSRRILVIKDN